VHVFQLPEHHVAVPNLLGHTSFLA
jgi:hypothetical protein